MRIFSSVMDKLTFVDNVKVFTCIVIIFFSLLGLVLSCDLSWAHDHNKPALNKWFDSLKSGNGPCCSNADGTTLSDVDWESNNGKYRVFLNGKWMDVPDSAVLTGPNMAGVTMVWPMYSFGVVIQIRCFIPGSMT